MPSRDLVFAGRTLRKNPIFALTAILTIILGVGASTTIFSVTNAVLLRPLPLKDPHRLVIACSDMPKRNVRDFPFSNADFIDLREGDLRETLKQIEGPLDFMLVDIWIPMSRPALEIVAPHLRPRAVVVCDNTGRDDERAAYADYFAFINDPAQGFRTMTLPFSGGLEMSVRLG